MGGSLQFHYFSLGPFISQVLTKFSKVHCENFTPMIKPLKYLISNAVKIRTGVFIMKKSFTIELAQHVQLPGSSSRGFHDTVQNSNLKTLHTPSRI